MVDAYSTESWQDPERQKRRNSGRGRLDYVLLLLWLFVLVIIVAFWACVFFFVDIMHWRIVRDLVQLPLRVHLLFALGVIVVIAALLKRDRY